MAGASPDTKKALRQFFNCPCQSKGQGNGYVTDEKGRWKLGEMMQQQVETTTGVRPKGCAWWGLQNDPYVAEVLNIFNLAESYPHMFNERLDSRVYQGVIAYRSAQRRTRNWWHDHDEKKAEEKRRMDKMKKNSPRPPRRIG